VAKNRKMGIHQRAKASLKHWLSHAVNAKQLGVLAAGDPDANT